jgi:hypothetical protein
MGYRGMTPVTRKLTFFGTPHNIGFGAVRRPEGLDAAVQMRWEGAMSVRVRWSRWAVPLAGLLFVGLASLTVRADETRLAISGYDPVAYFTDGKPVAGVSQFEHVWHDARWRFSSAEHRDAFIGNPNHYAPQYDGYCSMGLAIEKGHKATVDPQAWVTIDGKLYVMHSLASRERWLQNVAENMKRDEENWPAVKQQPEPTD